MSKYTVCPADGGVGFNVSVVSDNGARNTLLGFATEKAAETWIAVDRRLNDPTARPTIHAGD
jgi:hypothetical protein